MSEVRTSSNNNKVEELVVAHHLPQLPLLHLLVVVFLLLLPEASVSPSAVSLRVCMSASLPLVLVASPSVLVVLRQTPTAATRSQQVRDCDATR